MEQRIREGYCIAGLKTEMVLLETGRTALQAEEYLCDFEGEPDVFLGLDDTFLEKKKEEFPGFTLSDCEYMWTSVIFSSFLWKFDALMLHSSAIVYEGKAYLFSAPSGTGKSTHTQLWREEFGEGAYILNDDKPVIRIIDGEVFAFGTPWSGKTDQNKNVCVPLQGICFIERAEENYIKEISTAQAIYGILNQTVRSHHPERMEKVLEVIEKILAKTRVYRLGCNISREAARVAYEGMNKPCEEEKK